MLINQIGLSNTLAMPGTNDMPRDEGAVGAYRESDISSISWATAISRPVLAGVAATALCAMLAVPARADPIVEQDGSYGGYDFGNAAVGWTQATGFTDVSISASLAQTGDINQGTGQTYSSIGPLVAYITTRIGQGTIGDDVVASSTQSLGLYDSGSVTLFSGLSLAPGSYYLVIQAPLDTYVEYSNAAYTLGSGVTGVTNKYGENGLDFEPADTFDPYGGQGEGNFLVTIDGTPLANPIPEPMTLSLFGIGFAALAAARRRG